jgi:hypothetical protein
VSKLTLPLGDPVRIVVAQLAAHRLFNAAGLDFDCWRAIRAVGVDLDHVTNLCGPIVRRLVTFTQWGGFELDPMGETAFVASVHGEDGETVVDLVAWSARDPETFGTFCGAGVLGLDSLMNPASYASGRPCMLYETPLSWLRSGCQGGCCILNFATAREAIQKAPGPLTTESMDLAESLLRSGILPARKLLLPAHWRAAA